jgi:hypothetical protein
MKRSVRRLTLALAVMVVPALSTPALADAPGAGQGDDDSGVPTELGTRSG